VYLIHRTFETGSVFILRSLIILKTLGSNILLQFHNIIQMSHCNDCYFFTSSTL